MPRGLRHLRLLLALVLCLQSSLAAAHCLRLATPPQHAAFHVEICTAAGIVTMDLGGADHEAPAGHASPGFCVACHGLPKAALPEPSATPHPAGRPFATARHAAPVAAPPLGARAPPYISRAPPAFS